MVTLYGSQFTSSQMILIDYEYMIESFSMLVLVFLLFDQRSFF